LYSMIRCFLGVRGNQPDSIPFLMVCDMWAAIFLRSQLI
jgi:hypothetical protein